MFKSSRTRKNRQKSASSRRAASRKAGFKKPLQMESLEDRRMMAILFVANDGDNTAGDGSISAPYETLAHAVNEADPGDVITLRGGTYEGGVTIHDPDITVRSHDGEWAVIESPIDDPDIHNVLRFHYTADRGKLQNVELVGGYYYALKTETNWDWGVEDDERNGASGLIIEDSKLHGSGRDVIKITPGSDDIIIRRNEIYDSGLRYAGNAEGIDNVNGDRLLVQDNYIHDIATNGVYNKGGAIGTVVERNLIENTGMGGVMVGFYTDYEWFDTNVNPELYENIDGVVRNNIIRNTEAAGIAFYASKGARVYNNTLIDVAESMMAGIFFNSVETYTSPTTFVVQNNIDPMFVNNIVTQSESATTRMLYMREESLTGPMTAGNNIYHDAGGPADLLNRHADRWAWLPGSVELWQEQVGGSGSMDADPMFDENFHLTATSPAVDAGRFVGGLSVDYDGQGRTDVPDIGADEFVGRPAGARIPDNTELQPGPVLSVPPSPGAIGTGGTESVVLPVFHVGSVTYNVDEAAGSLLVSIQRTGDGDDAATVEYTTSDVTAMAGDDYSAASGVLTFAPGETTKTISLTIADDLTEEGNETFELSLSNPTGGMGLSGASTATITIVDDDRTPVPGELAFDTATSSVNETASTATITVVRTGGSDGSVTVDFATSDGTATAGGDYTATSGTLTFEDGETTKTINIPLTDDTDFEGNETLGISLTNPMGGATLGSQANSTLTILENEVAPPTIFSLESADYTIREDDGVLNFTIHRTGDVDSPASVEVLLRSGAPGKRWDQQAYPGQDYNFQDQTLMFVAGEAEKTVAIPLVNDLYAENDEFFQVILGQTSDGAELGTTTHSVVTLQDDDSVVGFGTWQYVHNEGDGAARVTVRRVGDTSGSATVDYAAVRVSAMADSDFTPVNGSLTFAPGQAEKVVEIPLIDDSEVEGDEQFGVMLTNVSGDSDLGRSWTYVMIEDNDTVVQKPTFAFTTDSTTVNEDAGTLAITIVRTGDTSQAATVDYRTIDGDGSGDYSQYAWAGSDYGHEVGTLSFAAGETEKTLVLPIHEDWRVEKDERFRMQLRNPSYGAKLGDTTMLNVTILEDDAAIGFGSDLVSVNEDLDTVAVTVVRHGNASTEVAVDFRTYDRGGVAGVDYVANSGQLVFAAGETEKTITIELIDDALTELGEGLGIVLDNAVEAMLTNAWGKVDIIDND